MTARVKRNLGSALRSRTPERQNHELEMRLDSLLNARLKVAGDEFMPANYYLEKWG